jgi:hypothetical protein
MLPQAIFEAMHQNILVPIQDHLELWMTLGGCYKWARYGGRVF